eukprot:TRINITY_DN9148_c0_g1_i1.p5 TRINITY_DN9148_c0_g1~~TRINITY_DN9148_c0_g1_i1.p5  ORF type:complete len:124 (+),score=8.43 TRINITY_DN9148_c0_g1_i1:260-631(+)
MVAWLIESISLHRLARLLIAERKFVSQSYPFVMAIIADGMIPLVLKYVRNLNALRLTGRTVDRAIRHTGTPTLSNRQILTTGPGVMMALPAAEAGNRELAVAVRQPVVPTCRHPPVRWTGVCV